MTTENGDREECGLCHSLAVDTIGTFSNGVRVCLDCGAKYWDGVWRDRRAWDKYINGTEEDVDADD